MSFVQVEQHCPPTGNTRDWHLKTDWLTTTMAMVEALKQFSQAYENNRNVMLPFISYFHSPKLSICRDILESSLKHVTQAKQVKWGRCNQLLFSPTWVHPSTFDFCCSVNKYTTQWQLKKDSPCRLFCETFIEFFQVCMDQVTVLQVYSTESTKSIKQQETWLNTGYMTRISGTQP